MQEPCLDLPCPTRRRKVFGISGIEQTASGAEGSCPIANLGRSDSNGRIVSGITIVVVALGVLSGLAALHSLVGAVRYLRYARRVARAGGVVPGEGDPHHCE